MQSEVTHSATGADQPLSKTISTQYHDVELEVSRQEDGHTSFCLKQEVNRLSKEVKEQGSSLNKVTGIVTAKSRVLAMIHHAYADRLAISEHQIFCTNKRRCCFKLFYRFNLRLLLDC